MKPKHKLQVSSTLAKGTVARVFKGTYDGDCCAIKTVSSEATAEHRHLLAEAHFLQACDHRCIIKFKALCRLDLQQQSAGKTKGVPDTRWALVLEYAKDGSLHQQVHKQMVTAARLYSNTQALHWALDIAHALEYLHSHSPAIIHRDVKLSNMLCVRTEDGQVVAKLSDFGLLRVASRLSDAALQGVADTQQRSSRPCLHLPAAATNTSQGNSQVFLSQPCPQPTPEAAHEYSEVHDTSGRMTSYSKSRVGGVSVTTQHRHQQQRQQGSVQQKAQTATSQEVTQLKPATLTGVDALPASSNASAVQPLQSNSSAAGLTPVVAAAAAVSVEAAYGQGFSWPDWVNDADSMCSMFTDGTWVSGNAVGTSNGSCDGSLTDVNITPDDGSSGNSSSCCDWLLPGLDQPGIHRNLASDMTGQTGTLMYMAPEVFLRQHYTEKVDVFSFGVALYELMARSLLVFTQLPPDADQDALNRYAAKVAEGFRPLRPKKMPQDVWDIITWCWNHDPQQRPCMSQVVAALEKLLPKEQHEQRHRSSGTTLRTLSKTPAQSNGDSSSKTRPPPPPVEAANQVALQPPIFPDQGFAAEDADWAASKTCCSCVIS